MDDWDEIKRLREENQRRQRSYDEIRKQRRHRQGTAQAQVLQRERGATERLLTRLNPCQYLDELYKELSPELPDIHVSEWVWKGSSLFCQIKLGQNTRKVHRPGSGTGEPWGVIDYGGYETLTTDVDVNITINPDDVQIGSTIITDPDEHNFRRTLIREVALALQQGFPETYGPPPPPEEQSPPSLVTRFLRWLSS